VQADHDLWHALRKRAAEKTRSNPSALRARRATSSGTGRHRPA